MFHSTQNKEKKEENLSEEPNGFFNTECQEDNNKDNEPIEETLTNLLFFDFKCRQENRMHESKR